MASQNPTIFLEIPNPNQRLGGSFSNLVRIQEPFIGQRTFSLSKLDAIRQGPPIMDFNNGAQIVVHNNIVNLTVNAENFNMIS